MSKFFLILLSVFMLLACSKKIEVKNPPKKEITEGQNFPVDYISPSNIEWSNLPLPKDIRDSRAVKIWLHDTYQDEISNWSYICLLDKKNEQVILEASSPGSGGMNFLVLNKTPGGWQALSDIFGGFIFYPVPSKNHKLVIYSKSGLEYYRTELLFNGTSYKKKSSYEVPIELTRLNGSPIDFYKYFWFMNAGDQEN